MSKEQFEWIVECNQRCPRAIAATLLYNHLHTDWRDRIVRIRQPTLIIGGRKSMVPWTSQAWINQSIPDSELEIFEEAEGGGHFMFIENPEKFNRRVLQFLSRSLYPAAQHSFHRGADNGCRGQLKHYRLRR
jgi:non-heme chloroperoxidase